MLTRNALDEERSYTEIPVSIFLLLTYMNRKYWHLLRLLLNDPLHQ